VRISTALFLAAALVALLAIPVPNGFLFVTFAFCLFIFAAWVREEREGEV
jgi:hypothetical protein